MNTATNLRRRIKSINKTLWIQNYLCKSKQHHPTRKLVNINYSNNLTTVSIITRSLYANSYPSMFKHARSYVTTARDFLRQTKIVTWKHSLRLHPIFPKTFHQLSHKCHNVLPYFWHERNWNYPHEC